MVLKGNGNARFVFLASLQILIAGLITEVIWKRINNRYSSQAIYSIAYFIVRVLLIRKQINTNKIQIQK